MMLKILVFKIILPTDETKVELFGYNYGKKIKFWRKNGKDFLPENTIPTLKQGSGRMMFCSCFTSSGTRFLITIKGKIESDCNISIWTKTERHLLRVWSLNDSDRTTGQ